MCKTVRLPLRDGSRREGHQPTRIWIRRTLSPLSNSLAVGLLFQFHGTLKLTFMTYGLVDSFSAGNMATGVTSLGSPYCQSIDLSLSFCTISLLVCRIFGQLHPMRFAHITLSLREQTVKGDPLNNLLINLSSNSPSIFI